MIEHVNSWAVTQMTDLVSFPADVFDVAPDIFVKMPALYNSTDISTWIPCDDISHALHRIQCNCKHGTPCEHQIIGLFWTDDPNGSAVEVVLATYDKGVSPKFYELPT